MILYCSEAENSDPRLLDLIQIANLVNLFSVSISFITDHVAIVLKFEAENKEIFFLDSTSNVVISQILNLCIYFYVWYRVLPLVDGVDLDCSKTKSINSKLLKYISWISLQ